MATAKTRTRKATAKKTTAVTAERNNATRTQDSVRNVFLAGLGFYGKAFEEAQNQIRENRIKYEQRREQATDMFEQLVKRGEKVESDTRIKLKDLDLPDLKMPDHQDLHLDLRARLDQARDSFNALRKAVSSKSEAT